MRSPTDLDGLSRDQAEQDRKLKLAAAQQVSDLRWVVSSVEGRRFVWGLLADAGVFRTSLSHTDAMTNFNEGKRAGGLKLLADVMKHTPEVFAKMMEEAQNG